ncbi:MAG TPA: glutathione S-transferase N-terminal domain-containing protein [Polyangiaceae bacterium LLY-WYZ-15_(1-7)]|nr:glutathione S-transferase N-terminal domain-containing protein [Polyangiaceae bacterium LLY-WYZ-15_(1-7)]HJL12005.1 glutathione S-transferase N-terminal domain-containing protein [Polyangiaceae bacterium LLY-WYZ-15_(1-7)]HJL29221.1 glutathione S-transferase N-terminal domain-containing protein [Polyangiaceae bacterium LLY-WYZ-15_(1-7)]HJL50592.1 glutathione S-transferase N-terminal domain-containing protein [Polyangiaceae bacterium LLY-WYZ-15_(1-7)]
MNLASFDPAAAVDQARRWAATLVRLGAGHAPRHPREAAPIVFYDDPASPDARRVREALDMLGLPVLVRPCPPGAWVHRAALSVARGEARAPFLEDEAGQFASGDPAAIVRHLHARYGGTVPLRLHPSFARPSAELAARIDPIEPAPAHAHTLPSQPLELWSQQATPEGRAARAVLHRFATPHWSIPARGTPRLHDPISGRTVRGVDAIEAYLGRTYGPPELAWDDALRQTFPASDPVPTPGAATRCGS